MELINFAIQLATDYLVGVYLGWHIVAYMILSSLICCGFHPVAGHFISEHYIVLKKKKCMNQLNDYMPIPDTCSYYGPLNWITFNVGYHVEHHDFPSIPFTYLPMVKQIAPEFYDTLSYHTSWCKTIFLYITDPSVGPLARVKRNKF